ncbi:hypothetical protein CF327_g6624 [Tilletia walkeri]|nr:hypothetical protein CF327_g6624 [Tilletia walkeri]
MTSHSHYTASSSQSIPLTPAASKFIRSRTNSSNSSQAAAAARQSRIPTPIGAAATTTSHSKSPAGTRIPIPSKSIRPKSVVTTTSPHRTAEAAAVADNSTSIPCIPSSFPPPGPPPSFPPPPTPPARTAKTPPPISSTRRSVSRPVHSRSISSGIAFPSTSAETEEPLPQQSRQQRPSTADNSGTHSRKPSLPSAKPPRPPRSRSRATSITSGTESPAVNSAARLQREAQGMVDSLPQSLSNAIRIAKQKIESEIQKNNGSSNNNSDSIVTPIKDRRLQVNSGQASPAIIAYSPSLDNTTVILNAQHDLTLPTDMMLDVDSKLDPLYSPRADASARTSFISTHTNTSTTASATASTSTHRTSSVMSAGTTAPSLSFEPSSNWTSPHKSPSALPAQLAAVKSFPQSRSREANSSNPQSPANPTNHLSLEDDEVDSASSGSAMEYMNTVRSTRSAAAHSLPSDPQARMHALMMRKQQMAAKAQELLNRSSSGSHRRTGSEPLNVDPAVRPSGSPSQQGQQQQQRHSSNLATGLGLDLDPTTSTSLVGGTAQKGRNSLGGTDGTTTSAAFVSATESPAFRLLELGVQQQTASSAEQEDARDGQDLTQAHVKALPASRRPSLGGLRRWLSSSELADGNATAVPASSENQAAALVQTEDGRLEVFPDQQGTMFDRHWYTGGPIPNVPYLAGDADDAGSEPSRGNNSHRRSATTRESSSGRAGFQAKDSPAKLGVGEDGMNSAFASAGHPTPVVPASSSNWGTSSAKISDVQQFKTTTTPLLSPSSPVVSSLPSGLGDADLVRSASSDHVIRRALMQTASRSSLRSLARQGGSPGDGRKRLPGAVLPPRFSHAPSLSTSSSVDVPQRSSSRMSMEVVSPVALAPVVREEPDVFEEMIRRGDVRGVGLGEGTSTVMTATSPRPISDPTGGDCSRLLLYGRHDGSVPAYLDMHLPMMAPQLRILDISGCGLIEIPDVVAQCTSLTELNISANRIGTIPDFIGGFKQLQLFQADFCELVYLPYALHELSECLLVLSVRGNKLTHVPSWLHLLTSLERLNYEGNPLRAQWRSILDPLMRATLIPPTAAAETSLESPNGDSSSGTILARLDGLPTGMSGGPVTAPPGLPSTFSFSALLSSAPASRMEFGRKPSPSPVLLSPQGPNAGLPLNVGRFNGLPDWSGTSSPVASPGANRAGSNLLGAPFQPTLGSRSSSGHGGMSHLLDDDEEEQEEIMNNEGDRNRLGHGVGSLNIPASMSMLSVNSSATSPFATSVESSGEQERPLSSGDFLSTDPVGSKGSRWKFFRKSGRKVSTSGMKDFLSSTSSQGDDMGSKRKSTSRPSTSSGVMTTTANVSTTSFGTLPTSPLRLTAGFEPETPASVASTSSFFGVRRSRKASTPYADMTGSADASNFTKSITAPSASGMFASSSSGMPMPTTRTPLASLSSASPLPEAEHKFSPMSPFPSLDSQKRIAAARAIADAQKTSSGTGENHGKDGDESSILDDVSLEIPGNTVGPGSFAPSTSYLGTIPNPAGLVVRPVELWPEHFIRLRALMYYLRDLDELGPERVTAASANLELEDDLCKSKRSSMVVCSTPSASDVEGSITGVSSKTATDGSRPTSGVPSIDSGVSDFKAEAEAEPVYKDSASLRSKIISEIVSTEETYVTLLAELVEIYVRPARRPWDGSSYPPVPPGEQRAVFGNVDALLSFHQGAFLPALRTATEPLTLVKGADQDSDLTAQVAEEVADVFTRHAAFLRAYVPYVNGADDAQSRIMTWRTGSGNSSLNSTRPNSPFFKSFAHLPDATGSELSSSQRKKARAFLKRCREHPKHSQLSLESYLLLPVQRIPRYRLLLEQLRKSTPPSRLVDPMATTRALEHVATMASSVNESKRQSEQDRRLLQWQNRIRGKWPSPLVQPHRRFVREGQLVLRRVVKREAAFGVEDACVPLDEMKRDNAVTVRGDGATVDYLHQQSLSRTITVLLCNDLIALVTPAEGDRLFGGHDGRELVDLYGVLHLQGARAVKVVAENSIRVVDSKSVLYFACKSPQEAQSWAESMNLARSALKRS